MKKYIFFMLLPFIICMPVFATGGDGAVAIELFSGEAVLVDSQGEIQSEISGVSHDDGTYAFTVTPGKTYYLPLGTPQNAQTMLYSDASGEYHGPVSASDLTNSELFRLENRKSGSGAGLVSVAQYNDKALGSLERRSWLQFVVANTVSSEELKASCNLRFSARRDNDTELYQERDAALLEVILYVKMPNVQSGATLAVDEKVAFQPNSGERSSLDWEDIASVSFGASTDSEQINVILSTDGSDFYSLGDFSDAELFVRNFSGTPMLDAHPKALLTLENPWIARGDVSPPNLADCRIYEYDAVLDKITEVTALFTYNKLKQGDCWQIKTRRLGCYVISNKELDISQRRTKVAGATVGEISEPDLDGAAVPEHVQASSSVSAVEPTIHAIAIEKGNLTWPYPKKVPNTGTCGVF